MSLSKFEKIKEALANQNEKALLFDGFEDALVGYTQQFGRPSVACYDYNKCIKILTSRDKMTTYEAIEYFEYNTVGCGLGEHTPTILRTYE